MRLVPRAPLAELLDRHGFATAAGVILRRAGRTGRRFAVVVLEIDAGERSPKAIEAAIEAALGATDVGAWIGADPQPGINQFGLLLPGADEPEAHAVAEGVRARLALLDDFVSVSHGVAVWPGAGDSLELLLLRADMALYAFHPSSRAGRRSLTPAWVSRAPEGSGLSLAEVRCVCDGCGSHVTALASQATLSGSCSNCGGYGLTVASA
jgi:predicted signal transduction protein with EAL and GGDEF domain